MLLMIVRGIMNASDSYMGSIITSVRCINWRHYANLIMVLNFQFQHSLKVFDRK